MFAQKTTELLRRIRRAKAIGQSVLVVNFEGDTRYGTHQIVSHDVDVYSAVCVRKLEAMESFVRSGAHQMIVIDEGQFFEDLYERVTKWADELPIHIVVAGLDGDSDRRPFGSLLNLVPHAEEVVHLSAFCGICKDGTEAHFSKCIRAKADQVLVGGADSYVPVCRKHYLA
jgi:thymidine kinase